MQLEFATVKLHHTGNAWQHRSTVKYDVIRHTCTLSYLNNAKKHLAHCQVAVDLENDSVHGSTCPYILRSVALPRITRLIGRHLSYNTDREESACCWRGMKVSQWLFTALAVFAALRACKVAPTRSLYYSLPTMLSLDVMDRLALAVS